MLPPTARRIEEARRRGQVPFSPLLVRAASWLAISGLLAVTGVALGKMLLAFARRAFSSPSDLAVPLGSVVSPVVETMVREAAVAFVGATLPIGLAALLAATVAGVLQTRLVVSTRPERPRREAWEPWRSLGLLLVVSAGAAVALAGEWGRWPGQPLADGASILSTGLAVIGRLAVKVSAFCVVAGLLDFALRRLAWRRSLWMTRGEVEAERRSAEGDPGLRRERRRRHRASVS